MVTNHFAFLAGEAAQPPLEPFSVTSLDQAFGCIQNRNRHLARLGHRAIPPWLYDAHVAHDASAYRGLLTSKLLVLGKQVRHMRHASWEFVNNFKGTS
jgi:hypothetical protein